MKKVSKSLFRQSAAIAAAFVLALGFGFVPAAQAQAEAEPLALRAGGSFIAPILIDPSVPEAAAGPSAGDLREKGGGTKVTYTPVTGNWLNPSNQETFDLYRNGNGDYVLVYYREDGGVPTWYISDTVPKVGNTLSNVALYRSSWNYSTGTANAPLQVGSVTVTFTSNTAASYSWSIFGLFGSGSFVAAYAGGSGRTGMYYPLSTPGLGAMFGSHGNFLMANFAYYDTSGNPIWARGIAWNDPVINFYMYAGNSNSYVGNFIVSDSGVPGYFNADLSLGSFSFTSQSFFALAN